MSKGGFRRTKIVATIGPACAAPETLRAMIDAGVDVIRVNSSHGSAEVRGEWMELVRSVREEAGRPVALLVDLQGPRIRVGDLDTPRTLEPGDTVEFAPEPEATGDQIPTTYTALAEDVEPGSRILLDDGLLSVEVVEIRRDRVRGTVRYGGVLKSHKGINLPGVHVSAPSLTAKDEEDIAHALLHGADYIGVSFVRRPADVEAVRKHLPDAVRVVAKIEKAAALEDLTGILRVSDVLMVARGDLGVELLFEEVPLVQKRIIRRANEGGKAVITATQMLESMVQHPRPTRAEASDVANAILDGTDAVMLSAETAIGDYPVDAVHAMARIIVEIERGGDDPMARRRRTDHLAVREGVGVAVEDAIALATSAAAEMLDVPLIVCFTKSGFTARKIAAHRPRVPIVALSTESSTCRHLALVWGVVPELADRVPNYDAMLDVARETLLAREYVRPGELIVVTAGVPFEASGTTNLLKVETV